MATKNLAKDISKFVLSNPSKRIDMTLLKDKMIYAAPKLYSEAIVLDHMAPPQLRSILKKVRKSALDDLKHLKSMATTCGDSISSLNVISALGFLIDDDEFFQSIQSYVFNDQMDLTVAIHKATEDYESIAEQYHTNPNDPLFLVLLMEQFSYMEERLCSHARRFLFQHFSQSIDSDRIVISETYFKEMFYDFNSHIKGLIYNQKSKDPSIAHYSIHFQIPIIHSSIELLDRKKILILCDKQEIILHPKKPQLEQYRLLQQKKISNITVDEASIKNRFQFYATISHPHDIQYVKDIQWFNGIIFHPEYLLAAKGSPLTVEEWMYFLQIIEQQSQKKSIVFRLPAFDSCITTDDFAGDYPTKDSLYNQPLYYDNYLMAIAKVMSQSSNKISVHIPYVIESGDVEDWISNIKYVMHEFGYKRNVSIGFDLVFQSTINHCRDFHRAGQFVYNIDLLMADYTTHFRPYYDFLTIHRFKESHAYADITNIFHRYRVSYRHIDFLFIGHYFAEPSLFQGFVNGGFCNFGFHPKFIHDLVPLVEPRLLNKNTHIGRYAFNQARTNYYRELREKLGPDAVIKIGTYKKMLLEKESQENK